MFEHKNSIKMVILIFTLVIVAAIYAFITVNKGETSENNEKNEDKEQVTDNRGEKSEEDILESKIDKIIRSMTIDEKIGQMIIGGIPDSSLNDSTREFIRNYKLGGFILYDYNMVDPEQTVNLLNDIKNENKGSKLPLILSLDQEGGRVLKLKNYFENIPSARSVGDTNNQESALEFGKLLGKQVKSLGFNLDFVPVMDINSNSNNPVIGDRAFGDSYETVSKMGIEVMKGLKEEGIIQSIKHFPGHGDTNVDSHLELPIINKSFEELQSFELVPFKNAIENGADMVMVAHILLPKIDDTYPSSMSKNIITDVLREDLNYDGVVITDDLTMNAITNHFELTSAAIKSIEAGCDFILVAHDYNNAIDVINKLKEAVSSGEIKEDRIDESLKRIIRLKLKYNLKDEITNKPSLEEINE